MKSIAILFPGVGYTCEKPLLYYARELAEEHGYETMALDYGKEIHSFRGRTGEELAGVIELALERSLPKLREVCWEAYENVLFVSKSIGTAVACRAEGQLSCHPRHFLMTPIEDTLPWLPKINGRFVAGSADPYLDKELLQKAAEEYPDKVGIIFEGCNHSLEKKKDARGNIENVIRVLSCLETMLTEVKA